MLSNPSPGWFEPPAKGDISSGVSNSHQQRTDLPSVCRIIRRPPWAVPAKAATGFADIPHSIAVAFNIYAGGTLIPETSFAADGSISAFWETSFLHSGVDLLAEDPINVDVYYDGKTLTVIETDTILTLL